MLWRSALLGSALGAVSSCAPASRATPSSNPGAARQLEQPGPSPRGRSPESAQALNATCEACHVEIAREWRASFHAHSHTDPAYQRALAIEPLSFCRACHAPEADATEEAPTLAAQLGVACVTCHVLNGAIVTARSAARDEPNARMRDASVPHPVLRDARLEGSAPCANCHEFTFPDSAVRQKPELMQSSITEHAVSNAKSEACAACHMPRVGSVANAHKSHAFAGGHDRELVRSAVTVEAERAGSTVRIRLTPREVGHAFPTGDLFRRLEISAEALGPEWQVVDTKRRYLTRHWRRMPSPFGIVLRKATTDDRLLDQPLEVELALSREVAKFPIAWRAAYQRVEHPRSDHDEDSAIEGEIELGSGTLENSP